MASATSLPPAADAEAAARTRALEASLDAMVAAEMNLFHRDESEAILMHVHRWGWRWLVASLFCLPDPQPIRIDLPHTEEQVEMIEEEKRRSTEVGYLEMLAIHHQLATKCLSHYNSMHPGKEYEPAPGWLTQNHFFHNGARWAHGNFLARPKRSGCFSFLPGPRTLFFFELASRRNSDQVVTCTRLARGSGTLLYPTLLGRQPIALGAFPTMNQLLKPTVYWVSLFGGLSGVMAKWIPFARYAPVALTIFLTIQEERRCFHVDTVM
ncbi:uncharacterized protein LOC120692022 isoform X2 [Panicum virgatum]|uniref:uncharacterized protein LOC120692022 isoform X2 n=1 Tax=Panicum virgatum TaxID=38727 RepID=UPI0019D642E4|nr:uncharacterized protein LOC120692022 isoform X2 [Panicum virgatum]